MRYNFVSSGRPKSWIIFSQPWRPSAREYSHLAAAGEGGSREPSADNRAFNKRAVIGTLPIWWRAQPYPAVSRGVFRARSCYRTVHLPKLFEQFPCLAK